MGKNIDTNPARHYEQPLVPEHMTKQTIETLPHDTPYYVHPGDRDDYEPAAIFVTPDRRLHMSTEHSIDMDDAYPATPLELVGIMRTLIFDPQTQDMREVTLADLRFIENDSLVDIDPVKEASDQEELMGYTRMIEESVVFDGIIVAERGVEVDKKGQVEGRYYGAPALYPRLEALAARSDKIMKKALKRDARALKLARAGVNAQSEPTVAQSESKDEKTKRPSATVEFSHRD